MRIDGRKAGVVVFTGIEPRAGAGDFVVVPGTAIPAGQPKSMVEAGLARRLPGAVLLHGVDKQQFAVGQRVEIGGPSHGVRRPLEEPRAFVGRTQTLLQRTDYRAVGTVQLPVAVEHVIDAVVEVLRVAFGVGDVDGVGFVGAVFCVGTVAELERDVDDDATGLPRFAEVVGPRVGGLEGVVKSPVEVIDAALFAQVEEVGIGDARLLAGDENPLRFPLRSAPFARGDPVVNLIARAVPGVGGQQLPVGPEEKGGGVVVVRPLLRVLVPGRVVERKRSGSAGFHVVLRGANVPGNGGVFVPGGHRAEDEVIANNQRALVFEPAPAPVIQQNNRRGRGASGQLWFSQISKLLINWGLPFFLRFPCSPPLVALAAAFLASFRQRTALQLEILALRHQLGVLQRSVKRPKLTAADRFLWAWLSAVWEDWRPSAAIMKPETVIGWHRKGFGLFWRWKIRRGRPGRPAVPADVRSLIRAMSRDNPLWGAPRIHGELLKLGIALGESSVSKYMVRHRKPPSQTWRTFLDNHVKTMVSVDFFTVPTIRFQVLYVFLVLAHDRRRILHFAVTAHPTAEWTAQQIKEAFPWDTAPRYLLRDRDRIFGKEFVDQIKAMGIKQVLSAPRSPWQRAYVERIIGTIRRECLDHVIVFGELSLYRHLQSFVDYYHRSRTHLGLEKDSPESRPIQSADIGRVIAMPEVGGLHHRYERRAA